MMWHPWRGAAPIEIPWFIWRWFGVDCYDCAHSCRSLAEFMEHSGRHNYDRIRDLAKQAAASMVKHHGYTKERAAEYEANLLSRAGAQQAAFIARMQEFL